MAMISSSYDSYGETVRFIKILPILNFQAFDFKVC